MVLYKCKQQQRFGICLSRLAACTLVPGVYKTVYARSWFGSGRTYVPATLLLVLTAPFVLLHVVICPSCTTKAPSCIDRQLLSVAIVSSME